MRVLKQGQPANVMVFMADGSDHVTGKTGLTLAVEISKDGGAFAPVSPTVTERGNGWYSVALADTDTDTLGDLVVRCTATGADPGERVLVVRDLGEGTYTDQDLLRLAVAALIGTAVTTEGSAVFRDLADTKDRVSLTKGASGDRVLSGVDPSP